MCAKPFTFTGMIKRCFIFLIPVLMGVLILSSCGDEEDEVYSPKPRGYFRIDMPKKEYVLYDSTCPFSFEYARYAAVINDKHKGAEPCWLNIEFPRFKAT